MKIPYNCPPPRENKEIFFGEGGGAIIWTIRVFLILNKSTVLQSNKTLVNWHKSRRFLKAKTSFGVQKTRGIFCFNGNQAHAKKKLSFRFTGGKNIFYSPFSLLETLVRKEAHHRQNFSKFLLIVGLFFASRVWGVPRKIPSSLNTNKRYAEGVGDIFFIGIFFCFLVTITKWSSPWS